MIKNIVFDLGGVLVDWNPRYFYRDFFDQDEEKMEWFLQNICTFTWNEEQDGGRTIKEGTKHLCDLYPEWKTAIEAYYENHSAMFSGAFEDTVQIFYSLKEKGHPIFGLTNWSAETFPWAKKQFQFLNDFDGIIVSGAVKVKKPDPKIYEILCMTYNLKPQETLFVDDKEKNIIAAKNLGFHGVVYQDSVQFLDSLKKLGIL